MRRRLGLSMIVGVALLLPGSVLAQAPGDPGDPLGANPPVRQTIGMMDVVISTLSEADCRVCHTDDEPDKPSINNRHHLLTAGQPIPVGSQVPFPDTDKDGVRDQFYGCLSCHGYEGEWSNGSIALVKNCVVCHTASPHHSGPDATNRHCKSCHGDIVDDWDDGHYIPDYPASLVTPNSKKGDGLPSNGRTDTHGEIGAGGCNYCHDDDGKFPGDPSSTPNPRPDERVILRNWQLHHYIVPADADSGMCAWCHNLEEDTRLRRCQDCHGPDSLHNIQADSDHPDNIGTIVVGGEASGWGHVGRDAMIETSPGVWEKDSDCWGCHGFAASAASAIPLGPIVPTVYSVDVKSITAGTDTTIVLTGVGFTNTSGNAVYESEVSLTAADGSSVTLTPDAVTQNTLTITIPGDTAPGNYDVRAVNDKVASNPAVISVVPVVRIASVETEGPVTITGNGFGSYGKGLGISVIGQVGDETLTARIVSWTDTKIVADFGEASPNAFTVKSVFGKASSEVEKPDEPEEGGQGERTFRSAGGAPGKGELFDFGRSTGGWFATEPEKDH